MRKAFTLVILLGCFIPAASSGQSHLPPVEAAPRVLDLTPQFARAVEHEVRRATMWFELAEHPPQEAARDRTWASQHPVLVGALVGAGVGAASSAWRWNELYCATGGDEECLFHGGMGVLFGAGAGAGVGALVGVMVGR
jgi:hypothetical protein